ncbi:PilZ domain-containing protein [Rhizobium lemnae]|uniref:PilZ domain-containing protein n=1 Tax=Rhizobium lemnae TaxID=1214924 RepID=A0ABV8E646_9HYPH|nr:PilZ domain-containing protein [Rhizobium lemnae]MCJ8508228.1 PilZ domain-containing protein [Rhizobium lemnae]
MTPIRDRSEEKGRSHVSGKQSLKFLPLALLAILAGCNSSSPVSGLSLGSSAQPAAAQAVTPVVQAYCPQVVMLEQSAIKNAYAGNAKDDPAKLIYRASLSEATRACTANDTTLTIRVQAQGRVVIGPAGKPGRISLPINVEVIGEGDKVIYSQTQSTAVDVPAEGVAQFLFDKADVSIPNQMGGVSTFTRVRIGFDDATVKKSGRNKR